MGQWDEVASKKSGILRFILSASDQYYQFRTNEANILVYIDYFINRYFVIN